MDLFRKRTLWPATMYMNGPKTRQDSITKRDSKVKGRIDLESRGYCFRAKYLPNNETSGKSWGSVAKSKLKTGRNIGAPVVRHRLRLEIDLI
jgi:hypothetical protein